MWNTRRKPSTATIVSSTGTHASAKIVSHLSGCGERLAFELGVTIERLGALLNGPLQLRLRTFEGQDARAVPHRWRAIRLGQAFFGVFSH